MALTTHGTGLITTTIKLLHTCMYAPPMSFKTIKSLRTVFKKENKNSGGRSALPAILVCSVLKQEERHRYQTNLGSVVRLCQTKQNKTREVETETEKIRGRRGRAGEMVRV